MTTALPAVRGGRRIVAGVPLGPVKLTAAKATGAVIGLPLGLGLVRHDAVLIGISGVAYIAYFVGATAVARVRVRRFVGETTLALEAMRRGELAKANDMFARWTTSTLPWVAALARHNLGWILILQGRLEEAATLLEDTAEHHQRGLTRLSLLPTTRLDTGLCHALLGHIELGETWHERATEPVKAPTYSTFPGMLALLRAVIDCRRGRAAEAAVTLENAWTENEAAMTGDTLRIIRVVRAFACAGVDAPRNQGLVERVLGDTKPRYLGEFDFLGTAWPEMTAFLAAHHLGG
jgi:hypothetical protein